MSEPDPSFDPLEFQDVSPLLEQPYGPDAAASHERFGRTELAIVLSYYEIGYVSNIRPFRRGSRRAPKVRISAESGEYLLKRRAVTNNDPYRVAHAHEVQLHLASHNYPVAELMGTRRDYNSMLRLDDHTYELFRFVSGDRYDQRARSTIESGKQLGRLHRLLEDFSTDFEPPSSSFHDADLSARFRLIPKAIAAVEPDVDKEVIRQRCNYLAREYKAAVKRVNELGFKSLPGNIVHGDWHPGNVLYRGSRIVAVLDFDSTRIEPQVTEVANAVLQFGIRMGKVDAPQTWPEGISGRRAQALVQGYESGLGRALRPEERQALPWLMIEALIVEAVVPIAVTGRFARVDGSAFLEMVEQKVRWLIPRADILIEHVQS